MEFDVKIISKFSDYYDSLSRIYGVDNKIVFDRTINIATTVKLHVADEDVLPFPKVYPETFIFRHNTLAHNFRELCKLNSVYKFKILSVCGKPFFVGYELETYDYEHNRILPNRHVVISGEFEETLCKYVSRWNQPTVTLEQKRYLTRLHQEVKSPVIMIVPTYNVTSKLSSGDYIFSLEEEIPNLSKIEGFAKRYSKEQLYQDISYWIANVINPTPDIQPETNPKQSDKEKIVSHGFDLKVGFRHRK